MRKTGAIRLRALGLLALVFLVVFIVLQFFRPALTNPPVVADLQAPPDVKAILKTSCYNCHSNETQVPWFDKVVPAYWLVVRDVKTGRRHMNFSDFGQMAPAAQKAFLYESVNQIQQGYMPPANYLLIHPGAKVSPEQLDALRNYLHPAQPPPPSAEETEEMQKASTAATAAIKEQFDAWIAKGFAAQSSVQPELNGLAFLPGYQDWKAVSTTDRYDNNTFRVIAGNDVAQKAIAANKIHPWPDGSTFAKITWKRHTTDNGVMSGEFVQVELMTKDATKYASTEGWGFGRWRGMDLKPYGKNANYVTECTSCHLPMKENDYVYTTPIHDTGTADARFNIEAALPADLPYQPLQWRVITSFAQNPPGTMATLYGNDAAVDSARKSPGNYPPGAVLALVTWKQKEDAHWFGGRIPGKAVSVEFVTMVNNTDSGAAYFTNAGHTFQYELYNGDSLKKAASSDPAAVSRAAEIFGLQGAVMP